MVQTPTEYIPAFPSQQSETLDGSWNQTYDPGMSLRDYLAAKVAPAIIAVTSAGQHQPVRQGETLTVQQAMARDAYEFADAMLAARAQVQA